MTNSLEKEIRTRQNNLAEKERIFTCEHARIILCKRQIELGMLTACTTSYYLPTDNEARITEKIRHRSKVQENETNKTMYSTDSSNRTKEKMRNKQMVLTTKTSTITTKQSTMQHKQD